MKGNSGKKQTGRVNYVWVLAGGYLIYLAAQLLWNVITGRSDSPAVGVIGGAVFVVIGGLLLGREWRAYQYGRKHIDDPSTWSDEEEEETDEERGGEDA